jgi:hypothetical protein
LRAAYSPPNPPPAIATVHATALESTSARPAASDYGQDIVSGPRRIGCVALAVAAGCGSEPAPDPQPAPDRPSRLERFCDRELRALDRYAGPEERDGEPVPAVGMRRIARGLARVRPRLRRNLDETRRSRNLLRLLRRAEIAARSGQDRRLLLALEDAWLVADRIGVSECRVGSGGRPS